MDSAFYTITLKSGHFYIGASSDIIGTKSTALSRLRHGKFHNSLIQQNYKCEEEIEFEYKLTATKEKAKELKTAEFKKHQGNPLFCNVIIKGIKGNHRSGVKLSREHIAKLKLNNIVSVNIDGVEYPSYTMAAEALGLTIAVVYHRVNSIKKKWDAWSLA